LLPYKVNDSATDREDDTLAETCALPEEVVLFNQSCTNDEYVQENKINDSTNDVSFTNDEHMPANKNQYFATEGEDETSVKAFALPKEDFLFSQLFSNYEHSLANKSTNMEGEEASLNAVASPQIMCY
jgi:hypothetical protein